MSNANAPRVKFNYSKGQLQIGNRNLQQVLAITGQLPCYVYDRSLISKQIDRLRATMPEDLCIHYAMKANPRPTVVNYIARKVDGLDVASHKELKLALETDMPPDCISMAGPGKTENDLRCAIAAQIFINVESINELTTIYTIKDELGVDNLNLSIRVNPDFKVKGSGMTMGGRPLQFGIDTDQLDNFVSELRDIKDVKGIHLFSGSQNLNEAALCTTFSNTFKVAKDIVNQYGLKLKKLNIGGGLGIAYFDGEDDLDLEVIGNGLSQEMTLWKEEFSGCAVEMELGRFIVGEAGVYLFEVVDTKTSKDVKFLVTNGGLHHHLSATGNFGQVFRRNYPIEVANKMGQIKTEKYHVVGPLCTPIDTLGNDLELPKVKIGDVLAIFQSGAYGFTASPHLFLGQPEPMEILL